MGVSDRKHSALRSVLLSVLVLVFPAGSVWAGGGPRDVAIVINSNSSVSVDIGRYYQAARGIPESNICMISCPQDEIVSWTACERQIREPIRRFLGRPEVAGRIHYLVLTKGIPLGADYVDGNVLGDVDPQDGSPDVNHYYSVASMLADIDNCVEDVTGPGGVPDGKPDNAGSIGNPYGPGATGAWGFSAPVTAWRSDLFDSGGPYDINKRLLLVTRLDGYTVDQIKTTIDRGLVTALDGIFVLDRNTWTTGSYKTANLRLGNLLNSAYDYLVKRGCEIRYDAGADFICEQRGVMGYFSWASNDDKYTFPKYTSNAFVPGSIADTYYSFSGRTFTNPGTASRSPLIADLFATGLCGAGGYVSEPLITTATYPNVLFDRYTQGFSMAESFYAACPNLRWKTVIVGDPLMAPYATPPTVSINLDHTVLHDVETIPVTADDSSGVSKVRFFLDDEQIAEFTTAPYTLTLDTREYPIGPHTIEVIAYEDSPVATQGSARLPIIIDNPVSAVARISDIFAYAETQAVRVRCKVVTAGTDEIGDGFYIEESDRSSGIKVISSQRYQRGDLVTVTGPMCQNSGDRAMIGSLISFHSSGAEIPGPLFMRLADLGGRPRGGVARVGGGWARNTGLLVKVCGRVTSSVAGRFYMTDGSTPTAVPVNCPGLGVMAVGSRVVVTGISVGEQNGTDYTPCIRARSTSDIQSL